MKTFQLTESEIANAETGYGAYSKTKEYTIVRRPQHNGKHLVAAIHIGERRIITSEIVDTKEQVPDAVKEVNRWMDKAFGGGPMSHFSRRRRKER